MFPRPDENGAYDLKGFSVAGLTDLRDMAVNQLTTITASVTPETVTDAQLDEMEQIRSFVAAADQELDGRRARVERFRVASAVPERKEGEEKDADDADSKADEDKDDNVTASGFDANGNKDVSETTAAPEVANAPSTVVEASITAAGGTAPRRAVTVADVAAQSNTTATVEVTQGVAPFSLIAAADIPTFPTGSELTMSTLGRAFEERVRPYAGMQKGRVTGRTQHPLAMIRREYPDGQIVMEGDSHQEAFLKLRSTADAYAVEPSRVAAAGWCAPSEPDYSICNPTTATGLLNLPEMVLRRGGLMHTQGMDFADFFGNDTTLPIPGYNILTEAQVIADTAKTCIEIPCPDFVDDRLNVAALCLTSSLLQNRGYPEFVAEFTQGAIAALAHLVNREVINEIATGSTAVSLNTVDPWQTDGTVYSQVLSAVEHAIMDMRYIYRTAPNQRFTVVMPLWLHMAMRADYIRRNGAPTRDLTDAEINAAFSARGADIQWVYDWQDAFNPNPGTIATTNQLGHGTPAFNVPVNLSFLVFLPGTWVLGRQDVIRLDTVYDSAMLQQNLVTQLFLEDGFKPMRMCQHSRMYTVPICANGSTGAQRAVACVDATP